MPTPNVVTPKAVTVTIEAAVTSPYSSGARNRVSSKVPISPITREARLVGNVQATPRTVRAVRLDDGAGGDWVIDCGCRSSVRPLVAILALVAASSRRRGTSRDAGPWNGVLRWAAMKLAVIGSGYV